MSATSSGPQPEEGPSPGFLRKSFGAINPMPILREAIRQVPAVKYALGVLGVAAAVFVTVAMLGNVALAVFGVIVMIALMFLLVVFAALAKAGDHLKSPAIALTWVVIVLTCLVLICLFTSAFFDQPLRWRGLLEPKPRLSLQNVSVVGLWDTKGNLAISVANMPKNPISVTLTFRRKNNQATLKGPVELRLGDGDHSYQIEAAQTAGAQGFPIECVIEVYENGRSQDKVTRDVIVPSK